MNTEKKKILIISGAVIIALALVLTIILLIVRQKEARQAERLLSGQTEVFVPDFLDTTEKQSLGISPDLNIQALRRDETGAVQVYKIIADGEEPVDPAAIGPLSPLSEQAEENVTE